MEKRVICWVSDCHSENSYKQAKKDFYLSQMFFPFGEEYLQILTKFVKEDIRHTFLSVKYTLRNLECDLFPKSITQCSTSYIHYFIL